jgi:hypothetical protein
MWQPLFDELTRNLEHLPERPTRPLRKPTAADLDQFEVARGFKLPQSYREFATIFGPGLLARYFWIAAPGCPECGTHSDLEMLDKESPSQAPLNFLQEVHEGGDIAQMRRMVFFCETEGAESIGWDPTEVTDQDGPEYEIYLVPRLGIQVRVANSFPEFIHEVCLGKKFPEYVNLLPTEWGGKDRRVFEEI